MLNVTQYELKIIYLKHHLTIISNQALGYLQQSCSSTAARQHEAGLPAIVHDIITDDDELHNAVLLQDIDTTNRQHDGYYKLQTMIQSRFKALIAGLPAASFDTIFTSLNNIPYLCGIDYSYLISTELFNKLLLKISHQIKPLLILLYSRRHETGKRVYTEAVLQQMPPELSRKLDSLLSFYIINQYAVNAYFEAAAIALDCYQYAIAEWYFSSDKVKAIYLILKRFLQIKTSMETEVAPETAQEKLLSAKQSTIGTLLEDNINALKEGHIALQLSHYAYIARYTVPQQFFYSEPAIQRIQNDLLRTTLISLKNSIAADDVSNQPAMWFFMRIVCASLLFYSRFAPQHPILQILSVKFLLDRLASAKDKKYFKEGSQVAAMMNQLIGPLVGYCHANPLPRLFRFPMMEPVTLKMQLEHLLHHYEPIAKAIFNQGYNSAAEAELHYQKLRHVYKQNLQANDSTYSDILRHGNISVNFIPLNIFTDECRRLHGDAAAQVQLDNALKHLLDNQPAYYFIKRYLHQTGLSDIYPTAIIKYHLPIECIIVAQHSFINIVQTNDNRLILIIEFFFRQLELPEGEILIKLNKSVMSISEWLPHENKMRLKRFFHLFPDNDYIVNHRGERVLFSRWFFECVINGMEMFVAGQGT